MLLLVTIVALGIAQVVRTRRIVRTDARNKELEAINAKLRAEAGYLEITDPSKVAVLRLTNLDEYTWRWKVWLPPGSWWLSTLTLNVAVCLWHSSDSVENCKHAQEFPSQDAQHHAQGNPVS